MRRRPKAASRVQDISPWIARFLLLPLVEPADQNTKDVMERYRSASVAGRGTGHAAMHPLFVADRSRICILEKQKPLRSGHLRQVTPQRVLMCP